MDRQHALLIRILHQPGKVQEEPEQEESQKVGREAFIYLSGDSDDFAQCGSCWLFDADKQRCAILGPDFEVDADDSCSFYAKGDPVRGQPLIARVTPEEAGFVSRPVRCENCKFGGGNECQLYVFLNKRLPDIFDLDTKIEPLACCNAQTPG